MKFKELAKFIDGNEWLSVKYPGKPRPVKKAWWDTESEDDLIELKDALEQFGDWEVEAIEAKSLIYSDSCSKLVVFLKEENKMTHEKYNELQKKMDKLASDFVDEMAEIEKNGEEMTSEWLDNHMTAIYTWVDTDDEKVLAELHADYLKLKEMLEL